MTTKEIGDLFAFSTQDDGVVKIPKAAPPGLDSPEILTAAQFFGAVLLRGQEYFSKAALWQDDHKIRVNINKTYYIDFPENQLVSLSRISIEFLSVNLENLK